MQHMNVIHFKNRLINDVASLLRGKKITQLRTHIEIINKDLLICTASDAVEVEMDILVGHGRGYVPGVDVDVVIPVDPPGSTGAIIVGQATTFEAGTPELAGAVDRVPLVYAPKAGRFATNRRIGDLVRRREVVGAIGDVDVVAPIDGALRGLSSRGAAVFEGATVVEVDPRGDPALCFGVDERADRIAQRVVGALAQHLRGTVIEPDNGDGPAAAHVV